MSLPIKGLPGLDGNPPRLLYVSTLDRIISIMFPHLEAARAADWQVEIACQPTVYREDLHRHADAVHEVSLKRFPLHPANLTGLLKLIRLIRAGGYTVIHCHNPTGGFIGRLAATLAGTRALRVYTAHGFHFHRHGGRVSNLIYRAAETFAGHFLSDAVLVVNEEDYEAAQRYNVVPKHRLFLTRGQGISAQDEFNPANISAQDRENFRNEIGASPNSPILTMVGELIPRKRHKDALAAFVRIRERFPDAFLVLVGDGALWDYLQAEAQSLGIASHVRFLGFRRDISRILAATNLFIFPSGQEGLPSSIQEALAMEVPVVATDVRGCHDLVDDSCGRIVPLGDTEAMAASVCELLGFPPETQKQMGAAGRAKMLLHYDRAACVLRWQNIYQQLLTTKNR